MKFTEELAWRGFVNQTTYKDIKVLDEQSVTFYFGVDPSADSMTIGNLASAMMIKHFINKGHKAILLIGGATGLIGDPDGKASERDLKTEESVAHNKACIAAQYSTIFANQKFEVVDNLDWLKNIGYVEFLRDIGKHVPMRQMLGRDFVQSRLSESGNGISYAEFSYSLLQAYDFLHLHRKKGVSLQLCGADQWGNSIAGVDLTRRVTGDEVNILSVPLIVNKATGVKFGKSEAGAVWLDPAKTTPTQFYQFWINVGDDGVIDYLKIYTMLSKAEIEQIEAEQLKSPEKRLAQTRLAESVTTLIHGADKTQAAKKITDILVGRQSIAEAESLIDDMRHEVPVVNSSDQGSLIKALVDTGLASSNTEARRFINNNAISINGVKVQREVFEPEDFLNGRALVRRGKAFKDSAVIELGK